MRDSERNTIETLEGRLFRVCRRASDVTAMPGTLSSATVLCFSHGAPIRFRLLSAQLDFALDFFHRVGRYAHEFHSNSYTFQAIAHFASRSNLHARQRKQEFQI